MKQCPACGAQVAEQERTCPQCGAPLPTSTMDQKSKTTAAILALFLGGLGIHYFYLGKSKAGIICIAVVFLTFGIGSLLPLVNAIGLFVADETHFQNEWLNPDKTFPIW